MGDPSGDRAAKKSRQASPYGPESERPDRDRSEHPGPSRRSGSR
jgi:hypothetical protein